MPRHPVTPLVASVLAEVADARRICVGSARRICVGSARWKRGRRCTWKRGLPHV